MAKVIDEIYLSCDDEGTDHELKIIEIGAVTKVKVRKAYLDSGDFQLSLTRPNPVSQEQRQAIENYTNCKLTN